MELLLFSFFPCPFQKSSSSPFTIHCLRFFFIPLITISSLFFHQTQKRRIFSKVSSVKILFFTYLVTNFKQTPFSEERRSKIFGEWIASAYGRRRWCISK